MAGPEVCMCEVATLCCLCASDEQDRQGYAPSQLPHWGVDHCHSYVKFKEEKPCLV